MATYFASRPTHNLKSFFDYQVVDEGSLRTPFIYRLVNDELKGGYFADGQLMAIKTKHSVIYPIWNNALYGQGNSNENGIAIQSPIVPDRPMDQIYLTEITQAFNHFLYEKPELRPLEKVILTGGTMTVQAYANDEWYVFDHEIAKEILKRYKGGDYSAFR